MSDPLARELVSMMQLDQQTLAELTRKGEMGQQGHYHPTLRTIHERNAKALTRIIREIGWPGISQVGKDGAEAAWLIAQHAVFDRAFMSSCADLLEAAVAQGNAEGWQLAFLRDRLLVMDGQPQIYGTQFDPDDDGWPAPSPIQDSEGVNERRHALGLNSIEERTSQMREEEAARREAAARAQSQKGTGFTSD